MFRKLLLAISVLALFALPVHAQTATEPNYPAFDIHRISLAVGLDYSWLAHNTLTPSGDLQREFKYGLFGAYVLGRNLSATGSIQYGASSNILEEKVGLRLMAFNGAKWGAK